MSKPVLPTVRTFAPERWGEVDYFTNFYAGTHVLNGVTRRAIGGVRNHYDKAALLMGLAQRLAPTLEADIDELDAKGYTEAGYARQFTAVIEEAITELYSVVDCTRKIIVATRKGCRRMPTDSTRRLFRAVVDQTISSDFPDAIKDAILEASWYEDLLFLRDELTHSDVGRCHMRRETKAISYMHTGIKKEGVHLVIDDILEYVAALFGSVNEFVGKVFHHLNSELAPMEIDATCGFFFGRIYMRRLSSARPVTLQSGTCFSRLWFDKSPGYRCPLADNCEPYKRAVHQSSNES